MSLADTYVEVLPDTRRFGPMLDRDLGRIDTSTPGEKAGSRFVDGMGRGLRRLGSIGVHAVAGLSVALGGAAVAAGTLGVKTAAANENAEIAFTTMLKSGQKARTFLDQLKAFAAATPFEFSELQTAASSLISIGVQTNKIIPIMTTLGNVTSGMGTGAEGVKRATVALQQMNAAGRITAEDLNQLRDAGIPVYDLLAAATGRSKAELAKMAQSGKLGRVELEKLMKALETGKGLERFAGLMDKQSASINGLWSTLKDTFSQGMATAIAPAIPLIKEGLGGAIAFASNQLPGLATRIKSLVEGLPALKDRMAELKQSFDTGGTVQSASGNFLDVIAGAVGRLVKWLPSAADHVRDFFVSFKAGGGTDALSRAGTALQQLAPALGDMTSLLPSLTPLINAFSNIMSFLADHVDALTASIPFLIAGYVAFRTVQLANNVVGKDSLLGSIAMTAGNFALAASNRTLAAAIKGSTFAQESEVAVQNVSLVTRIRNTAATIASTVAQKAAAVATKAWAAVQWLVNAALSANPIGIVIVAVAALTAGIIYAYKHSETFRKIVTGAWIAVQVGASFMWNKVLKPTFAFIIKAFLTVAGSIVHGAAYAFGWVPGLGPKLKDAAKKFDTFKNDVNRSLASMDDRSISVSATFRATYGATAGGATVTAGNFSQRHGLKTGGLVPHLPGSVPHEDSVDATLVPGEYVVTESGSNLADAIAHFAKRRKFKTGGLVAQAYVPTRAQTSYATGMAFNAMTNDAADEIAARYQQWIKSIGAGSGAGVQRWTGVVLQALQMLGQSTGWLPTVLRRMNQESGGNPAAINLWDSNAKAGHPSQGLMQVIPGTFAAYAGPLRGLGILNPLANVFAGLNYAIHRYGSLSALNRAGGYDTGGLLRSGNLGINMSGRPERVLSPEQTDAFERLVAVLESGGGTGSAGPRTLVIVDKDGDLIGRMRVEAGGVLDEELREARWGEA